jgi:hypothetical protein
MPRKPSPGPGASFRIVEKTSEARRQTTQGPWAHAYQRQQFDFSEVNPAALVDGIDAALSGGASLTFSLTKDGGAVKVSIWQNNEKFEAYAGDADTLNELMYALVPEAPTEEVKTTS